MFDQFNHAANALNLATNSLTDTNTSNLALAGTSAGLTDPLQQNIRAASSASFSATSPGVFTVGATGKVNFDYLFDGGAYEGEVAIFDLDGMDRYFQAGSEFFAREAALRALTNTDLGHIVISDQTEGARFSGSIPYEGNLNSGTYTGAKTFTMHPSEHFGIMLVPNGTVAEVLHSQSINGSLSPLFSVSAVNPGSSTHFAELANPSDYGLNKGDHNIFGIEDLRLDGTSDREYNDVIFQVQGATGGEISLDQVIDPSHEWRNAETGQKLMQFVAKSFDTAGNSFETAQKVTLSPNAISYTDGLGKLDTDDFYSFHLDSASSFNLALTGRSAYADVQILDHNQTIIASSMRFDSSDEAINLPTLASGDYYVRIFQGGGNTPYTLQLSTANPSNLLPAETDLGVLSTTRTFDSSLYSDDTADVYRFSLSTDSSFNAALTGLYGDADIRLIQDANHNGVIDEGEVISSSTLNDAHDESINLAHLAAGDYFLQAYQYSGVSTYTLKMSNQSPNNLLSSDVDLGVLSGTSTFSDSVNSSNTSNIYSFWLTNDSNDFNATLTGLSGDADLRLIREVNGNGMIDSEEIIGSSFMSGNVAEMIRQPLTYGHYFLQVNSYNSNANYNLSISTGDWYSTWLSDPEIIGQVRTFAADGQLDRKEMISLLTSTEDGGIVEDSEFRDLQRLMGHDILPFVSRVPTPATSIMPDYVRVLSDKVVNGDRANTALGSNNIGNLVAGSSASQMEKLIDMWFRGKVHPIATPINQIVPYQYQEISGDLFQKDPDDPLRNSIHYQDVVQQGIGDCYFLASLAAVADRSPGMIEDMFVGQNDDDDNGIVDSWTIRFFNSDAGAADYVTVDRFLPTDNSGNAVFAAWNQGLWVALAEKAYAQINASGWIGQDGTNSYNGMLFFDGINGGKPFQALNQITGRATFETSVDHRFAGIGKEDVGRIADAASIRANGCFRHEFIWSSL